MRERFLPLPILTGFLIAILAVVSIGFLAYKSLQSRESTAAQIAHTLEVRTEIQALLESVINAETGQRGFLLTGDSTYLAPYEQGRSDAPVHLANLHGLTTDNPEQQARLSELQPVLEQKLAELGRTVELARQGDSESALRQVRSNEGRDAMDRIRALLDRVQQTEEQVLDERMAELDQVSVNSFLIVSTGCVTLLGLILLAAYMTGRDIQTRTIQAWLKAGQSELAVQLAGNLPIHQVSERALSYLATYLGAQVGAMYVVEPGSGLRRSAGYGLTEMPDREIVARGESLLGQAVQDNRVLEISDVPAGYLPIASGVGQHSPLHLVLAPTRVERSVNGVIELGFFRPPGSSGREFLDLVSTQIGLAFRSAQDRERVSALLEETQRQGEELQTQQEELRVSNEELTEQSRALQEAHVRLENQQAELEQTNSQLEEQAAALEKQKASLEQAQESITQKANDLERASTYKSEFLANMSHELRTPLNSSLILAKLLADNKDGNLTAEQIQFADTIHSAGRDLLNLINDILDLSKIEAGKADLHSVRLPVARIVEPLRRTFTPIADEKKLTFTIHIDPGAAQEIETDDQRIQQVLRNLLSNAFKFTERGEVSLRVSAAPYGRIAFAVRDSGIGIPAAQHEVIFEPFRQADAGTTRKHGGTGLGLSISRDLAHLLGGTITLESSPGQGSTFTLVLPLSIPAAAGGPPGAAPPPFKPLPEPPLSPASAAQDDGTARELKAARTLLVIEDDAAFAKIVAALGEEQGYRVVTTSTADQGVRMARMHLPTAIVLDIGLPDHSGLAVLDQLKRNSATRHIPVHVVSSYDHAQTALEMGAVGYMVKPVRREALVDALKRVESRTAQANRRVLVVEDDPVQRDSIARLLSDDDVEIVAAATAAEAVRQLEGSTFDCMVMDLKLPDGSGFDLLERIGADEKAPFPPVIVYTGRDLSRDEEQRLRRHSRSIIIKDARSPERLLDEVTLFLHQVESRLSPEHQRMLKEARNREAAFDNKRILVVEDDVRNIFALSKILEPKGAKVEIARNGREALDAMRKLDKIDLVLMDIMMPEMDGYQAVREIRKDRKWADVPIIALTAKAMPDDQEKCLQAGANDYIAKPLDVDKLLSLARVWMSR